MKISITHYQDSHIEAVRAFNARLRDGGGGDFQFPEYSASHEYPKLPGRTTYQEFYVAVEEPGGAVRGGYILKTQLCTQRGEDFVIGNYQLPLSEGTVDGAFGMVGVQLLFDALRRQPRLYCLGMGGTERPLPKMLKTLGWSLDLVPFFFRVVSPSQFFREVRFFRTNARMSLAARVAQTTGLGWLLLGCWRWITRLAHFVQDRREGVSREVVADFEEWVNPIWRAVKNSYDWIGARDVETLRSLYPAANARFTRLKISAGNGSDARPVGWALILATQMSGHKHFGDLRVGTIADILALPGFERAVVAQATAWLEDHGRAELIVSNQSASAWKSALSVCGFIQGPSNYAIAFSKPLAERVAGTQRCHLTRGDGDGPIHL